MNLSVLLGQYTADPRIKQIAAGLSLPEPKLRLYLDNLRGSSVAFVATAVWQLSDANHVFVLNDREEAAYFHNDLEHLTDALDIQYFPDSFKKTGASSELNASHVMLRTEALAKLVTPRPPKGGDSVAQGSVRKKVLVTYPEALFEKVVHPKTLSGNTISVKVGEKLKLEELMERLVKLGFRREDFVYEPGQFAMRGGIFDIYSYGNEHPYRIELFGNEVDSIRLFNPETQLSERRLLQVSILPNIEVKFESQEKISLLDFLPDNTCFWFKDLDFCYGKLGQMEEALPEKITLGQIDMEGEEEQLKELTRKDFEVPEAWMGKLRGRHLVEWFNHSLERYEFGDTLQPRRAPSGSPEGGVTARVISAGGAPLGLPEGEMTSRVIGAGGKVVEDPMVPYDPTHGLATADREAYPALKKFVAEMRSVPTPTETTLWDAVRNQQVDGCKFRRQHILGRYIADFVCLRKRLIIELDGHIHQLPENKASDQERTEWLNSVGYEVIRFSNDQVKHHIQDVMLKIKQSLNALPAIPGSSSVEEDESEYSIQLAPITHERHPRSHSPFGGAGGGRNEGGRNEAGEIAPGIVSVLFATEEQPAFNRQFDLLIKDLKGRCARNCTPYIFAENPKQLERLRSVFEDLNADIQFVPVPVSISKGFIDHDRNVVCYTDHQIFQRYHKYQVKQAYSKGKAITLKALRELQPGDFVSHIDHGVGVYSGLQKIEVNGSMQEAVRIIYKDNDVLYVNINSLHKISKFTGKEGHPPRVNKLGSDAWEKLKNKTKKQVKDIAADLIKLYAKRKASKGFPHTPDTYLQTELEASFFYEDTPDQAKATADVKRDMEAPSPMDRLVCGDVGFGKTEVAVRAAFKTVVDGKQAAILVPTTILAFQHFQTFKDRLKDFPCTVDFINRFKSAKEKKETLKRLEEGKIDIIIGTHALIGKDVKFKELGVLIIDEEQKFGVKAKEQLRERKATVDTLTLTATPIPRTLQFSLMNARDMSIINTPPPNRQPVQTEILTFDEYTIRDAIYYETERGGQVYFVHNRVQSLPEMVKRIQDLCPDLSIQMAHGQMEGSKLESVLIDFMANKFDVLCCTNIVESGVDIPNSNTIIINNAHQFGLSDLHQLRGRVGRSNKKAFCYLIAPPLVTLPGDSRKRLQTLEQFNELGSGFQIAMRDLDIRGAGNLLGGEQSGFITDIGFEMYQKILDEAMRELRTTDFKDVFAEELERKRDFVSDCTIDTDLEILIPDSYVGNITERLSLYTQLDDLERDEDLVAFKEMLEDRFGPAPVQVVGLFTTLRARRLAKELGFEKLILKNEQLRLYFISNPESPYFESPTFQHIMKHIQTKATHHARLKQVGKNFMLLADGLKRMEEVLWFLEGMVRREEVVNPEG